MNKQEPIKFKVLSDEEIQTVEHKASNEYKQSINHEQGKFLTYNLEMAIKKGICQAQLKDTLNQVKGIVCDKCRDMIDEVDKCQS